MNRDLPSMAGFANNKRERTTKGTIKITKRHKKLRKPFCAFFEFALCLLCTSSRLVVQSLEGEGLHYGCLREGTVPSSSAPGKTCRPSAKVRIFPDALFEPSFARNP